MTIKICLENNYPIQRIVSAYSNGNCQSNSSRNILKEKQLFLIKNSTSSRKIRDKKNNTWINAR